MIFFMAMPLVIGVMKLCWCAAARCCADMAFSYTETRVALWADGIAGIWLTKISLAVRPSAGQKTGWVRVIPPPQRALQFSPGVGVRLLTLGRLQSQA